MIWRSLGICTYISKASMHMNTWCNANSVSFKCYSISVTLKFCSVLVALCAPEPRSMDSLGTQHCANFESHSNRVIFETNAISITSSIHARYSCTCSLERNMLLRTQVVSIYLSRCMYSLSKYSILAREKLLCLQFGAAIACLCLLKTKYT